VGSGDPTQRLSKAGWLVDRTEAGVGVVELERRSSARGKVADLRMTSGEWAMDGGTLDFLKALSTASVPSTIWLLPCTTSIPFQWTSS
jgi:hypothetical protein